MMTATQLRYFLLLMFATALGRFEPTRYAKVLEAEEVRIVDGLGRVRATFGIDSTGEPGISLLTAEGDPRASLAIRARTESDSPGVGLSFMNHDGNVSIYVGNSESDHHGDSQSIWLSPSDAGRALVSLRSGGMGPGPELALRDNNGDDFFFVDGGHGGFQPMFVVRMPEIADGEPFGPQKKGGVQIGSRSTTSEGRTLSVRSWSGAAERELDFD